MKKKTRCCFEIVETSAGETRVIKTPVIWSIKK